MELYSSLTPEQRKMTGTEEYRARFQALDSVSGENASYERLVNVIRSFMSDVSRMYICVFDTQRDVMVYVMDSTRLDPAVTGDWEPAPRAWMNKLMNSHDYSWDEGTTPYDIRKTEDGGRICITAYPIQEDDIVRNIFLVAELSIDEVITEIIQYALNVSAVVLALTLLISLLVGIHIKKTVADPINAIAGSALSYVQDRRNGVNRSSHFSSLRIKTGDELENLANTMAEMEGELIAHEDQIEALLDSLVKALSTAIDDRSHYTGNHTNNMVLMADAFLNWMEQNGNPWQYDEIHHRVFIMSVGLHDIGKLTVPLEIMDKSTRLGLNLERIQQRFSKISLLDQIAMLKGGHFRRRVSSQNRGSGKNTCVHPACQPRRLFAR